jgi:hypothetical protein
MEIQLIQVQEKIYEIRGVKVMLDFDLAEMYGIETKRLKEQVRRNIKRFAGNDFMFELTKNVMFECSRSQIATLNKGRGSNIKYLPWAFTELGVAMLSSVLNSDAAIEINRNIMRAFVVVRQLILSPPIQEMKELRKEVEGLKQYIEESFADYNDINDDTRIQLELINQSLAELQVHKQITEKPRRPIGFNIDRSK